MALSYDFLGNNFTTYAPIQVPPVEFNMSLSDDLISLPWAASVTESGVPIVTPKNKDQLLTINTPEEVKYNYQPEVKEELNVNKEENIDLNNESLYSDSELKNMSFKELIESENLPIRITSAFRKGAMTTSGNRSNHSRKDERGNSMAYDIAPASGHSWEEVNDSIYKNPTVVKWFKLRNWGVLEEMIRDKKPGFYDTEGKFHRTGATGPHFHIGPDTYAVKWYNHKVKPTYTKQDNPKTGSLDHNVKLAYTYLINNGVPKGSAAGIVGNLYWENLKNPLSTVSDSRGTTAYGMAGFNSRGDLPNLLKWSRENGINGNPDFYQQLDYLIYAIKSRPKLSVLLDSSISPDTASFIFGKEYERFAGSNGKGYLNIKDPQHVKRAKTALNIFNKYANE